MDGQILHQGFVQEVLGIPVEGVPAQFHHPTGPFQGCFQVRRRAYPVVHAGLEGRIRLGRVPEGVQLVRVPTIDRLDVHHGQVGDTGRQVAPLGRLAHQTPLVGVEVVGVHAPHLAEEILLGGPGAGVLVVHRFKLLVGQGIGRQRQQDQLLRLYFEGRRPFRGQLFTVLLHFGLQGRGRRLDFLFPFHPWHAPPLEVGLGVGRVEVGAVRVGQGFVDEAVEFQPVQSLLLSCDTALDLAFLVVRRLHGVVVGRFAGVYGGFGLLGVVHLGDHRLIDEWLGSDIIPPCQTTQAQQQQGGRRGRHRLLGADHPLKANFRGQQVDLQGALVDALQGQSIGDRVAEQVVPEGRLGIDLTGVEALEGLGQVDLELQFLLQVLLQARQLEGVAQPHQVGDLGAAVGVAEVGQRPLKLVDKVGVDGLQGGQDGLQVGAILADALGGVALDVLGLGEGELELLGQCAGEMVAADVHRPLHDGLAAVGDHQCGFVRPNIQRCDAAAGGAGTIVILGLAGGRVLLQLVEDEVVGQRQGRHLDGVHLHIRVFVAL